MAPVSAYSFDSPTIPRLIQSRAIPSIPFHQTHTMSPPLPTSPSPALPPPPVVRPIPLPRPLYEVSPSTSSPSLYSRHTPHNAGHGHLVNPTHSHLRAPSESSDNEGDDEDLARRLSMISGPTVRKYADNPWEENWVDVGDHDDFASGLNGLGRHATRIMRSATQMRSRTVSPSGSTSTTTDGSGSGPGTGSTRRGLVNILGVGKHLLPSASGVSLASTQTTSTSSSDDRLHPITPKLKSAFALPSPTRYEDDGLAPFAPRSLVGDDQLKLGPSALPIFNDRPLLSSGSPGFGLISLEVAQERERVRAVNRSQAKAHTRYHTEPVQAPASTLGDSHRQSRSGRPISTKEYTPAPIPVPTRSTLSGHSSPPVTHRLKGKKSGLMKLFNKASSSSQPTPSLPIAAAQSQPCSQLDASHQSDSCQDDKIRRTAREGSGLSEGGYSTDGTRSKPNSVLAAVQPQLELRPVSMTFTHGLPSNYLTEPEPKHEDRDQDISPSRQAMDIQSGQTRLMDSGPDIEHDLANIFAEQMNNARKAWRVQRFELEAQIRELKDELDRRESAKAGHGTCDACGCNCGTVNRKRGKDQVVVGVMNRARVKTAGARGVFGTGSLYEWER